MSDNVIRVFRGDKRIVSEQQLDQQIDESFRSYLFGQVSVLSEDASGLTAFMEEFSSKEERWEFVRACNEAYQKLAEAVDKRYTE